MKTTHIGLTLAAVFAAKLSLGQEAPVDPPTAPAEPAPAPEPAPPAEPPPAPAEPPPPAPSESPPTPAPAPSSTATFPTPPPPPPAPSASAPAPAPTVAPSARPPVVPPPPPPSQAEQQAQAKRVDDLAKKEKEVEGKDDTHGVFGPFRIGPIFGVGLPAFFSIGGAIKLTKFFGAGINYGIVPTIQFSYYGEATVRYQGVGIYGHIHPFGGGFFLGASIGYAHVRGTYEETFPVPTVGPFPYKSEATMQTLVLTPELGYLYTFKSGFTLGIESGLQIPVAPSEIDFKSTVNYPDSWPQEVQTLVNEEYIEPTDAKVESTLEKVGQTILPTIGIKIGWLF